ncbi:MAG TPA: hypothetical protein VGC74_14010 [Stenotrophomonas sp.]|jgi:hypothetical protein
MRCDNFSLMRGGATHALLSRLGLIGPGSRATPWLAISVVLLAFAPLAMACVFDGTLWRLPGGMPLLGDYAAMARYLVALPLLVLMAPWSDHVFRNTARQLVHSALVAPYRQADLEHLLRQVRRCRDAIAPELICLAIALAPAFLPGHPMIGVPGVAGWSAGLSGEPTQAGQWQAFVSMPLYRFVMLMWLWRLLMWSYLLWRLTRLRLDLHPLHPDGNGGLGFLGLAQERFSAISLANAFVLCGAFANHMIYGGDTLFGLRHLIIGFIAASAAVVLAPLLLLTPTLIRAKRHALLKYDALGNRVARSFDRRWPRGQAAGDTHSLLDAPDASALCDFTDVYGTIKAMPAMPIDRWIVVRVVLYGALPLLPLVLLSFSVDQLAEKLFGILF